MSLLKFRKITLTVWNALPVKDANTRYTVYSDDGSSVFGEYIGDKLIGLTTIKRDSEMPSGENGQYNSFELYCDTIIQSSGATNHTAVKSFEVKGIPISPIGDRTLVSDINIDKVTVEWYDEEMEIVSTTKPSYIRKIYWGDAGDILIKFDMQGGGVLPPPEGAKSVKFSFESNDTSRKHTEATPIDLIVKG